MKRMNLKKMSKIALAFVLILSFLASAGMTQVSAYAMGSEQEEPIPEAAPVEAAPVKSGDASEGSKTYYVDFHFENQQSELKGGTSCELDQILGALGVTGEVVAVECSSPELFSCEQNDGVWTVSALESFHTEESLTLSMADGSVVELQVSDPEVTHVLYNNAKRNIILEVRDDGTMVCSVNPDAEVESDEDLAIVQLFQDDGLLKSALKTTLQNTITKIVLGEGIKGIGWEGYTYKENPEKTDVFRGFKALEEVIPSSTLEVVGWSAFRKCSNLSSFDFSICTQLRTIMQQAFNETALPVVDLSNTQVTKLQQASFSGDKALETLMLPETVTEINETAFQNCNSIQNIEYNVKNFEHGIQNLDAGGNVYEYLCSTTFKASINNGYDLTIGADVESLPQGFFKAMTGAASMNFAGAADDDDSVVTGRELLLNKGSSYKDNRVPEPFRTLALNNAAVCVVDESGVVYEKNDSGLNLLYFSPELSQYALPFQIQVSGAASGVNETLGSYANGKVVGKVVHSLGLDDVTAEGDLPAFQYSDTILVLNGEGNFEPFTDADLTAVSFIASETNEDGETFRYTYTLSGWEMRDGSAFDPAALSGGETVELVAKWDKALVIEPEEEDMSETPESPEANETDAEIEAPAAETAAAPVAAAPAAAARVVAAPAAAAHAAAAPAAAAAAQAEPAAVLEDLDEDMVPLSAPQAESNTEEILAEATPLAAAHTDSGETATLSVILPAALIILAGLFFFLILKKRNEQEEN